MELSQYRELQVFARFGSDLDKATLEVLRQGERIVEITKQPQYQPMPVEDQVIAIYTVMNRYVTDIEVDKVRPFVKGLLDFGFKLSGNKTIYKRDKRFNFRDRRKIKSCNCRV